MRQHTSEYVSIRQHAAASRASCAPTHASAYVSIRQHATAYVSISRVVRAYACVSMRQHTSAYVSIRQHTSAYVSIRQHTSAYVSIRQHTSAYVSISQLRTSRFFSSASQFTAIVRFSRSNATSSSRSLRARRCAISSARRTYTSAFCVSIFTLVLVKPPLLGGVCERGDERSRAHVAPPSAFCASICTLVLAVFVLLY
jgi:hypothetical protein